MRSTLYSAMYYVPVLLLGIFNGLYSSWSMVVFALQGLWYPSFMSAPLALTVPLSGVISGLLHLLVTGIPVAMFEKFKTSNSSASPLLWLACMLVPTWQTVQHMGWF